MQVKELVTVQLWWRVKCERRKEVFGYYTEAFGLCTLKSEESAKVLELGKVRWTPMTWFRLTRFCCESAGPLHQGKEASILPRTAFSLPSAWVSATGTSPQLYLTDEESQPHKCQVTGHRSASRTCNLCLPTLNFVLSQLHLTDVMKMHQNSQKRGRKTLGSTYSLWHMHTTGCKEVWGFTMSPLFNPLP